MGRRGDGGAGLLLFIFVLASVAFYGPPFTARLAHSVEQSFTNLAPVVGPMLAAVLVVLVIRYYWSRW